MGLVLWERSCLFHISLPLSDVHVVDSTLISRDFMHGFLFIFSASVILSRINSHGYSIILTCSQSGSDHLSCLGYALCFDLYITLTCITNGP